MRKSIRVLLAASLIPCSVLGVRTEPHGFHKYVHHIVSKGSLARSAAGTAIGEARNSPKEWGRGGAGIAKRFGSAVARGVVDHTIELGVATVRHEDLQYHPSHLQGKWPRLKYAVESTFVVPRTNRPGRTVAAGRISGSIGSGLISRAWQPASTAGIGAGLASGGITLGADVGIHVAREFWPKRNQGPATASIRKAR
jgi:hypothetical protein